MRDEKGNLLYIMLPEVGIGYSRNSITVGGTNSFNNANIGGAPMLESSYGANVANGMATIVDGAVIGTELFPTPIIPRSTFNNVAASAAAGKLIAKGNVLLTWTAVTVEGIDIYNNKSSATNADYAKFGVDISLTGVSAALVIASFIPGVNIATWVGVGIFAVSTANTFGVFDPLYKKLNK